MNNEKIHAWFVGAGIGSLAGAAFLVRDGGVPGKNITILEELPVSGGSCDGTGTPDGGYVIRGGRMMNLPTYECTWDLFREIPSITTAGKNVYEETLEFNSRVKTHAQARLVTANRKKLDVHSMGFSQKDRMELLALTFANEDAMGDSRINDWFSPDFFKTNFWFMWATTFAFQPWHSAAELKRYMIRFMHEFPRIQTLAGVARTTCNQYESLVLPLQRWLEERGVQFHAGCMVTDLDMHKVNEKWTVTGIQAIEKGKKSVITVGADDLVFMQNGSMTESTTLGSMTRAPEFNPNKEGGTWDLWKKIAARGKEFGNPEVFCGKTSESTWESFTVTMKDPLFFNRMEAFSGNKAGTGALVTFKDSNWLMSVVLAYQPHFLNQPEDVQVFWGYGLFPDRVGNFVPKKMADCTGAEILEELRGHIGFEAETFASANCIPCMIPYITSQFMPRKRSDRPLPVPENSKNLGFISQYVEIPGDVVFTVEYSVRAAQTAVYKLLGITRKIPAISRYDKTLKVKLQSVKTAFRKGKGPAGSGK